MSEVTSRRFLDPFSYPYTYKRSKGIKTLRRKLLIKVKTKKYLKVSSIYVNMKQKMDWAADLYQLIVACLFFSAGFLLCVGAEVWQALTVACLFTIVYCELVMKHDREKGRR